MTDGPGLAALLVDDLGVLSGTRGASLAPVVRRIRAAGLRVAVLSNAEGPPREGLVGLADTVVLSGQVGLRKPDPAIYLLAAARLGVAPGRCVVVDDLARNVRGAVDAGMTGVLHRTHDDTLAELEALFGLSLR